jgi:L-seryl-tRNA(Ser) seleniumtransferase
MRVDKITLAALVATLRLYRDPVELKRSLPLLSLLSTPIANLKNRAERLAPQLAAANSIKEAETVEGTTYLGGGSVPTQEIPTCCVALTPSRGNVDGLAAALRTGEPAVFGRVHQDRLLLDLRSVFPHQDAQLVAAIAAVDGESSEKEQSAEEPKQDDKA